jgi:hypothetical protein
VFRLEERRLRPAAGAADGVVPAVPRAARLQVGRRPRRDVGVPGEVPEWGRFATSAP